MMKTVKKQTKELDESEKDLPKQETNCSLNPNNSIKELFSKFAHQFDNTSQNQRQLELHDIFEIIWNSGKQQLLVDVMNSLNVELKVHNSNKKVIFDQQESTTDIIFSGLSCDQL